MKKLFLFTLIALTVASFSLVAVGNAQAASGSTDEHGACTSSSECADGLTCDANPWFGATTIPAGAKASTGDAKICCSNLWGCVSEGVVGNSTGLGDSDPREIAARVINIMLGFLGIIAVVLILAGGFMWMTAAGNDDKVASAKKVMIAGVIGLVIVLAAFGIAKFVVNALMGATA